jgi:N-acetylglucosamine kinase-like BadF-type ATPase
MIIIADSGSTKTHWKLIESGKVVAEFTTQGLNPYYCKPDTYRIALIHSFPSEYNANEVGKVCFYGAGCSNSEMSDLVRSGLCLFFQNALVKVYTDILAAARALFGTGEGIAIILGSGANIGYYNGEELEHKTPSLGFVLGDEGSGAYLGKGLIKSWLYDELPKEISFQLQKEYPFSINQILNKIYAEPFPNRFLASFIPFLERNSGHPYINKMVDNAFENFVHNHLLKYKNFKNFPIGVVGSVGAIFQSNLSRIIEKHGGNLVRVVRYPITELVNYHLEKA